MDAATPGAERLHQILGDALRRGDDEICRRAADAHGGREQAAAPRPRPAILRVAQEGRHRRPDIEHDARPDQGGAGRRERGQVAEKRHDHVRPDPAHEPAQPPPLLERRRRVGALEPD